jgi:hypothetical protein
MVVFAIVVCQSKVLAQSDTLNHSKVDSTPLKLIVHLRSESFINFYIQV